MKTKFASSQEQCFFHRYIVNSSNYISSQKMQFQGQNDMNFSLTDFGNSKTSLHKCRLVTPSSDNLEEWPMHLLKRVSYEVEKKSRKNKPYEIVDSNIKKLSQIKTQYLCYQILSKSHRVVKLIEIINQNSNNQNDKQFFYQFLKRKEEPRVKNVCFILQFCNDKNLKDRIQNSTKPLTENQIVIYCCQILQGLIQLKKKGILHRDLRPCNIFLHNNQIKFGDFDSAFIYKESPCPNIKNGIDINTTPQEIVELAALSDQQLQAIGNFKLYQLQSKCDIYFFGMIIFKMVYKRDYEKKFQGTDLDYLVRQKLKNGFKVPKLLKVMKMCLQINCDKRIDLIALNEEFRQIQKHQYFVNQQTQKAYLIKQPMNLFSYNTLQDTEILIQQEIQNFINHTFTYSFVSVEHDFQVDFQRSSLIRNTKLYVDTVAQILSKKRFSSFNLWGNDYKSRQQNDKFIQQSQDFVAQINLRAFFYDKLYQVILKIDTNQLAKKQHKEIILKNKETMEKQLIYALRFFYQILSRTPFKVDKHYQQNLSYEVRNLFKNIIKVNKKAYFYNGRAKTFNYATSTLSQIIDQFYKTNYQESQLDSFQSIYLRIKKLTQKIDSQLKKLLRQGIIDLLRPYESIKKSKKSNLKQILFVMIILQKQNLTEIKKNELVELSQVIQPIFNSQVTLDKDETDLFFQSFKILHSEEVQRGKQKENIHASMNLISGISSNHLNCLSSFFSQANSERTNRSKYGQDSKKNPIGENWNVKITQTIIQTQGLNPNQKKQEEQKMKVIIKDVEDISQGFQKFAEDENVSQNQIIST